MKHPDTLRIQSLWYFNIEQMGILCQIPFYILAQQFGEAIEEFQGEHWMKPKLYVVQ